MAADSNNNLHRMKLNAQTTFLTLVGIAGAIVLATVFFITGYTVGQKAGYDSAKARLAGYLPQSTSSATTMDGTVKEVRDGVLVITTGSVSANPLDDNGPSEREVTVNASTKLSENSPKTSKQIKADEVAYHEAINKDQAATPPTPYALTSITLPDLKVGDRVRVSASDNIYYSSSFIATEVQRLK